MCFDACPVHACMPHVAPRIAALTPSAKIILMLRNPVSGLFSAEVRGEGENSGETQWSERISGTVFCSLMPRNPVSGLFYVGLIRQGVIRMASG